MNRSAEKLSKSQRNVQEMGAHQGFLFPLLNFYSLFFVLLIFSTQTGFYILY
jgi:hypothetical protein